MFVYDATDPRFESPGEKKFYEKKGHTSVIILRFCLYTFMSSRLSLPETLRRDYRCKISETLREYTSTILPRADIEVNLQLLCTDAVQHCNHAPHHCRDIVAMSWCCVGTCTALSKESRTFVTIEACPRRQKNLLIFTSPKSAYLAGSTARRAWMAGR